MLEGEEGKEIRYWKPIERQADESIFDHLGKWFEWKEKKKYLRKDENEQEVRRVDDQDGPRERQGHLKGCVRKGRVGHTSRDEDKQTHI